jgi:sialate O-acetylesterase
MISPLMGLSVKGSLWYQEEGNHRYPELYPELLSLMVSDLRKQWEIGNFPFYFVQMAPYSYPDKGNADKMGQEMANCAKTIPNSRIAIKTDAVLEY